MDSGGICQDLFIFLLQNFLTYLDSAQWNAKFLTFCDVGRNMLGSILFVLQI
jgi:hypothetical protein